MSWACTLRLESDELFLRAARKLSLNLSDAKHFFHFISLPQLLLASEFNENVINFSAAIGVSREIIAAHCMWQAVVVRKQTLLNWKWNCMYIHFFSHQTRRWASWFDSEQPSLSTLVECEILAIGSQLMKLTGTLLFMFFSFLIRPHSAAAVLI